MILKVPLCRFPAVAHPFVELGLCALELHAFRIVDYKAGHSEGGPGCGLAGCAMANIGEIDLACDGPLDGLAVTFSMILGIRSH